MAASLSALNYFMPLFSFLFVFVLVYALLAKTKVLGDNNFVHIFISLILAIFFIVNVSLVDFVKFSSAWVAVFIVLLFLILVIIAFTHGKVDVVMKPFVAWILLAALIIFFIVSASVNFGFFSLTWSRLTTWASTDWFGFILLVIVAAVVAWVVTKKAK
jgi:hypothetical protein